MGARKKGKVYLVGAGPGDRGLITERGKELLSKADIIFYDRLTNPNLLLHARDGARKVYVGKGPGRKRVSQEKINKLLVREALSGRLVVRLKGGDPILFGRGAEEAIHLKKKGIPFEIVPGVSAATAVPTYAGIPLTLRGYKSSVTILTGHEAKAKGGRGVDWDSLLKSDSTFVVLMGVKNLAEIVRRFLAAGKKGSLPAALIESGGTSYQRTVVSTLSRIASTAGKLRIKAPAVLVVGETVALHRKLSQTKSLPLCGLKVLVPRPVKQAENIVQLLEERGAAPIVCPLIKIKQPRSFKKIDQAIRNIRLYDWVIFTSVNGVRAFSDRLDFLGMDSRSLAEVKICAIGPATEAELKQLGLRADCRPREFSSNGIIKALSARRAIKGRAFLLPRSDLASSIIPTGIRRLGGKATEVVAYRTVKAAGNSRVLRSLVCAGKIDVVLLTSPSIAEAYARVLRACRKRPRKLPLYACLGPETAKAARRTGLRVAIEAQEYTDKGLVKAIANYWRRVKDR